jgi:CubicO group peptidase (beta-lactamase class C family)
MPINRRDLLSIGTAGLAAVPLAARPVRARPLETAGPKAMGFDAERLKRIPAALTRRIDAGEAPGFLAAVVRDGRLVHFSELGVRDVAARAPMARDTIFRIMSMTKPIVSVAAMMLVEENRLRLTDPVAKFIPSFAQPRIYVSGEGEAMVTAPAKRQVQVRNLLMHTSGLSYGTPRGGAVEKLQAERKVTTSNFGALAEFCDAAAALPLLFEPGTKWNYGISTDVLGRVVEVAAGQPLADFLRTRIFAPLGMTDTAFFVPPEKAARLATSYRVAAGGLTVLEAPGTSRFLTPPAAVSGGGGLASTADDYLSFCMMLLNGGTWNGARLLGPETVRLMRINHLPKTAMAEREAGFGLGFGVDMTPAARNFYGGDGSYYWSGALRTHFWVDPAHRIVGLIMTQVDPFDSTFEEDMRALVYQAFMG